MSPSTHSQVSTEKPEAVDDGKMPPLTPKPFAFWAVFAALCVACLLSALDLTAVSTALPTIISDLEGEQFVWIGSAYTLTSTALMPISGPLANVFGRRPMMIAALLIFMLGSGLAGGAKHVVSMNMMIAARAVQGAGGGLILALSEIVITDLVPLRERGVYAGILGAVWALASAVGPPIGGALSKHWDWLFFLNLPLGVVALILVGLFLRVKEPKEHWSHGLKAFDWVGSTLIIGGSTAVIIGLVWGGATYPWDSFRVLVPLIVGGVSLVSAFIWERKFAKNPIIPWEIVETRTALSGHLATWLHGFVSIVLIYYLTVYFQAVRDSSPIRSGVQLLPTAVTIAPAAIAVGAIVTITGKYRMSNYIGWSVTIVGWGLLSLFGLNTKTYAWVLIQLVLGVGIGILYSSTLFPVLAPVPVKQGPHAMGFYVFMRNFGQTFGVSIGGTILQNQLTSKLPAEITSQIHGGGAELSFAIIPIIKTLAPDAQIVVKQAFNDSLRLLWLVMIGFSAVGLLTVVMMKEIPLQTVTDDDWGLEGKEPAQAGVV